MKYANYKDFKNWIEQKLVKIDMDEWEDYEFTEEDEEEATKLMMVIGNVFYNYGRLEALTETMRQSGFCISRLFAKYEYKDISVQIDQGVEALEHYFE